MAQYVTPTQLSGLFKETYGDEIQNLIPEVAKLVKLIPFVSRDKETGNKYHQPVIVQQEQGVSYASADAGAFDLEDSVSMTMKDAQVQGSQMLLRSAMSYDSAARASSAGKKSFAKGTQLLVENMMESLTARLEVSLLHGQSGIADIAIGGFDETAPGSTTASFVVSPASWAAGIFAGAEGAKVVFYNGTTNANLDANENIIITAVDIDTRTISVSGSAGAIEDLNDVSVANALTVYFKGSVTGSSLVSNEMAGLRKILTNSGTLFNISAATHNLWKGNSFSAGSAKLTMAKVQAAVGKCVERGLNEKVVCLVNPKTWANLSSELSALRSFDSSYDKKKGDNGFESISYHGQNGEIEVIAHNMVKEGEAFIFPPKRCKRIGSQEISFKTPGMEDEIFLHLQNKAGFELRVYSDQSLFLESPARAVYISGIVNE